MTLKEELALGINTMCHHAVCMTNRKGPNQTPACSMLMADGKDSIPTTPFLDLQQEKIVALAADPKKTSSNLSSDKIEQGLQEYLCSSTS